jgi:NDP-sugar pyrophosphorylase family protein
MRVRYSWETRILGSAGGPRRALPLLESDPFLIVNGDTLSSIALAPMQRAFAETGADVLMAVVPNPAPDHYNGIRLGDDGRVTAFVPKGREAQGSWHYIGIQIVRRSVFAGLRDDEPSETVAGFYRSLVANRTGAIHGWPVDTHFLDVGTPRDYFDASRSLAGDSPALLIDAAAALDSTATLDATIVWRHARVGPRAHLEQCIVAGGVVVPDGFSATRSILIPAHLARSGDAARVADGVAIFPLPATP